MNEDFMKSPTGFIDFISFTIDKIFIADANWFEDFWPGNAAHYDQIVKLTTPFHI